MPVQSLQEASNVGFLSETYIVNVEILEETYVGPLTNALFLNEQRVEK